MTQNNSDVVARAYVTLASLRKNIDQINRSIPEKYVQEYHTVLDKLTGIGLDITEFRIPDSELQPEDIAIHVISFPKSESPPKYSKEKYVDKPFILTKIDAILGYFEFTMSEKPRNIGFRAPEK